MSRQALAGFVVINIIVSVAVVIILVTLLGDDGENSTSSDDTTQNTVDDGGRQVLIITATSGFSGDLSADQLYGTIAALQNENRQLEQIVETLGVDAEQFVFTATPTPPSNPNIPTLNPSLIPTLDNNAPDNGSNPDEVAIATTPDDGCERYRVVAGDVCASIADRFGVDVNEFIELNGIDAACRNLVIGQEVRIPGDFCKPPAPPTATPTVTRTPFEIQAATFAITNTAQPTAADTQVQIVQILNTSDVTREEVQIQNQGAVINLQGWTLVDSSGNTFTFPEKRLLPGGITRVLTRVGQNTAAVLYWNQTTAIWESGETATLFDPTGAPQSTYVVGGETINFDSQGSSQ